MVIFPGAGAGSVLSSASQYNDIVE